ncbi:hypothetical protein [Agrococcus carbonis]|uniref:hypothetical protein n=1 Tax=Agrococcus carbonis TaxID=684552 RepID=UPI0012FBDC8D|nr:hypothetical protein [Agrococcus carbonis]
METERSVPALVLRLTLLALCGAAGAVLGVPELWVCLVAGAVVAGWPHPILLIAAIGTLVGMFAVGGELGWQLPVLVLLTHAALRIGVVADAVSWRARIEVAVLRDAVPGFLAVQAVAQGAAALALALEGAAPVPWLVVGAVAALAVLCWVVVGRLRRT